MKQVEKPKKQFADETTIHAIRDFYHAGKIGRCFWGALGVLAVVGLSFQLEAVLEQYLTEEAGATLTEYLPSQMPTVSICPDDWVDAEKAARYNLTDKMISVLNGFMVQRGFPLLYDFDAALEESIQDILHTVGTNYSAEYNQMVALWNSHWGSNLDSMVSQLALDELNSPWHSVYPTLATIKQSRTITSGGVCYKFETQIEVNAMQSAETGIKMSIISGNGMPPDLLRNSTGFKVVLNDIGDGNTSPHTFEKLSYGPHYVIRYSLTKVRLVSTRNVFCVHRTAEEQANCVWRYGNKVLKGVSPHFPWFNGCETAIPSTDLHPASNTTRPCNTFVDLAGSSLFQGISLKYTNQKWNTICPRACVYTKYQYTTKVQNEQYQRRANETRTLIELQAATGMSSLEIKEYLTMTVSSMLSNVGGTLGLWMGASVMSIIQAVYLLCLRYPMLSEQQRACCCCARGSE